MAVFEYRALTHEGKQTQGVVDADTSKEACAKLRVRGVYVTEIHSVGERLARRKLPLLGRFGRVKLADLAIVTRQFATLIRSAVPMAEALTALVNQSESHRLQVVLRDVREKVTQGMSLADALGLHPHVFNDLYVNMVRAGEASGNLDDILTRLADYLQNQYRLAARVWAALTYPIVMVVLGTGIVIFLMSFLVPKVLKVLASRKQALPAVTVLVKTLSDFVVDYWPFLLIGAPALFFLFRMFAKTRGGKRLFDKWLLKIPVVGNLLRKQTVSRFSITTSILLRSGLPVLRALEIVEDLVGNTLLKDAVRDIHDKVMEGADVSMVMQRHPIFPPVVAYMVAVGEKAGTVEDMLDRVAEAYDDEIEIETQRLTSLIEPVLIIGLAAIVALIVLSVLLPLMKMSEF